ncbi:hypothetical protein KP509_22G064200 [Ceratopteris richardii]|uniref:Uncharacterized protein n=1 Tax=Ceratopteris richardii TaxID=49495 RepID=A0A8T2S7U7_CERRI|nr:hypothetical protein KP509_22G064200 [Ceratopteris richardii]
MNILSCRREKKILMAVCIAPLFQEKDYQLRELASMVERLESGRQKLLVEIDAQSVEIERLFLENDSLVAQVNESLTYTSQWEQQVQSFLQENGSLRAELKDLRSSLASNTEKSFGELLDTERNTERSKLQMELNSVKEEADTLRAQVLQLTASLNLETQHRSSLNWLYKPVLANIENRLQQLKHVGNQNQLPQLFVI